jgi:hypothetical protein
LQLLWFVPLNGLYHFVVALWRVNSAGTIFSVVDHFAPHGATIDSREIFCIAAISNVLPRSGVLLADRLVR